MSLGNDIFDVAATMAKMQAEGYRQVREQARREALEEAALPREATPAMLNARTQTLFHIHGPYGDERYYLSDEELKNIWTAMYDVATKKEPA